MNGEISVLVIIASSPSPIDISQFKVNGISRNSFGNSSTAVNAFDATGVVSQTSFDVRFIQESSTKLRYYFCKEQHSIDL